MRILVPLLFLLFTGTAVAAAYQMPGPGDDVIGSTTFETAMRKDTFAALAQHFGVGWLELVAANPNVDPWLPEDESRIEIPTAYVLPDAPREGLVINLAEYRLYLYRNAGVITFPVGIGRAELPTPTVSTRVVGRIEQPSWTPTAAVRAERAALGRPLPAVVPPGPDNPLGEFALQLALPEIFIHGTNRPFGVGQTVSRGCIRLYEEHIATLVELVPNETQVQFVYQPVKVGWRGGEVFVEAHQGPYSLYTNAEAVAYVRQQLGLRGIISFDEAWVLDVVTRKTGIPIPLRGLRHAVSTRQQTNDPAAG